MTTIIKALANSVGSMSNQFELPLGLPLPTKNHKRLACVIPPQPSWTDEEVSKLRVQLLNHSLHLLTDGRASYKAKKEIFEWVMSDDIHPFSFFICCEEGSYNPLKVRAGIKFMLRRLKVSFLH